MRVIVIILMLFHFDVDGQSLDSLIQRGIERIDTEPESAITIFKNAIELDQDNYEPWYYIAYCYSAISNYSESVHFASEAIRRKPNDSRLLALLGLSQILADEKVKGCENLDKSLLLENTDKTIQRYFNQLCGKYYRFNIYTELKDSTIVETIDNEFKGNWTLNSIGEWEGYLRFSLMNKQYLNYKEDRSFSVEWRVYVFNKSSKENIILVKKEYRGITSTVDYLAFNIEDKELIIAIIDEYLKSDERKEYQFQRENLINDLKMFVHTL